MMADSHERLAGLGLVKLSAGLALDTDGGSEESYVGCG